jgi:hypothetical protein
MVVQDYDDAESSPMPLTTTSSGPSMSVPGGMPSKPPRSPLRVVNPMQSDSDRDNRPSSTLRPQPSLLARARGLLSARSSRSNVSGNRSSGRSSSVDVAPVPPSAWQQRLPNLLSRNRSGSTDLTRGRSEDSAQGSDVTSLYFSAHGHSNPTPVPTPVPTPGASDQANSGERQQARADNSNYQQEVDAGVQLVVEHSPTATSPEEASGPRPPAYLVNGPGTSVDAPPSPTQAHISETLPLPPPDTHHLSPNPNRLSTLTQDTSASGEWDSTMSSGVIQTWEAARRPTGFVGLGRVLSASDQNTQRSQVSLSTAMSTFSDNDDGARLLPDSLRHVE